MLSPSVDWLRLMAQLKEVEARRSRSKPGGPALCQESWDFCGANLPDRDQSFSNGGCFPLSTPRLDVTRWEVGACINTNTELNRK